jgi:hypothetical protein
LPFYHFFFRWGEAYSSGALCNLTSSDYIRKLILHSFEIEQSGQQHGKGEQGGDNDFLPVQISLDKLRLFVEEVKLILLFLLVRLVESLIAIKFRLKKESFRAFSMEALSSLLINDLASLAASSIWQGAIGTIF